MKISGNTVLITGGATGIGFALAEAFVKEGNKVLICGRRKDKLENAKEKLPQIQVRQCDLSTKEDRESLCNWVRGNFKDLNILVNNAGIQRAIGYGGDFWMLLALFLVVLAITMKVDDIRTRGEKT